MSMRITVPDDVESELRQIPHADEFAISAIKSALEAYRQTLRSGVEHTKVDTPKKNKWAMLAEEAHKNSPLSGYGDEVNRLSREFRNDFSFKHDED